MNEQDDDTKHDQLVIQRIRKLFQVPAQVKISRWTNGTCDSYKWYKDSEGMAYSWFCLCRSCCTRNWWNPDSLSCQSVKKYTKKAFTQSVLFRCQRKNAFVKDPMNPNVEYIGVDSEQCAWLNGKPGIVLHRR